MKTTSLITQAVAIAVCMSCAVVSVAGPGNGKVAKKATNALFQVPRTTRGTLQRFDFSPAITRQIHAGIAAGQLKRTPHTSIEKSAPVVLGHTPQEISFSLRELVIASPLEKKILQANAKEQKFYEKEIKAAQKLHNYLLNLQALNDTEELAIATAILDFKNHSLQNYLFDSLAKMDLYTLDLDLTEYFDLVGMPELTAFEYTLRHPHQQTLMMRRVLNNPLVDEQLKEPIRAFLNKSTIKQEELPAFRKAILDIYTQYQMRLNIAVSSDIIQIQVNYYAKLVERLRNFIAANGRRPKWNTANLDEMLLFDEIEWVKQHEEYHSFEPFLTYQKDLNSIWDKAQPTYLTREETVALFDEFVEKTGRFYPYSLRTALKANDIPFDREEELWDNLIHWRIEDSSTSEELDQISAKYRK